MSKGKLLAVVMVWLVLFGAGAVAWKFVIQPNIDQAKEDDKNDWIDQGGSPSRYAHRLELALDSFSGYAVLRSDAFKKELAAKRINIHLRDDEADYAARLAGLQSGEIQMAVFTIDALIKASAALDNLPATMVAMIDETRGADAIVGYKSKFRSVDDFNSDAVRFVLTPDSPSETLARVVMTHFELPNLAKNPIVAAKSAQDVYEQYRQSSQNDDRVFVLWEPYVSKMMENPNVHTIISSRDLFGYIVDVLVVSRDYLSKNRDVVKDVLECYFRAAYEHRGNMAELVFDDAKRNGQALSKKQAESLVNGIQWKDTQHNYAHFGIGSHANVQHIEDMVENITEVLTKTSAIPRDPTNGQPADLFHKALLEELEGENFHPAGLHEIDGQISFRELTDAQWKELTPVGTLRVPELAFARSSSRLLSSSLDILDDLAKTLQTSQYYVRIHGNAKRAGDLELNKSLAAERAQAATDYLIERGIDPRRIRSLGAEPSDASSVTFMLGQLPY